MRLAPRLLICLAAAVCARANADPAGESANYLYNPECVTFDSLYDRYLVSSYNNNRIVAIDRLGNQSIFINTAGHPAATAIDADTLFICLTGNPGHVAACHLQSGALLRDYPVPGTTQLEGIGIDTSGCLYLYSWGIGFLKIDRSTGTVTWLSDAGIAPGLQDLIFDPEANSFLAASYQSDVIQVLSLEFLSATTLVVTPSYGFDGLAVDRHGNLFISSWGEGKIYRYDSTLANPPQLIRSGINGSANIGYDWVEDKLLVPVFNENRILVIGSDEYTDSDSDGHYDAFDNCPDLPNPTQEDSDGDSVGDLCDLCDGFDDLIDIDSDGQIDGCDDCVDVDSDGFGSPVYPASICTADNCPSVANPDQADTDDNGIGDACCCALRGDLVSDGSIKVNDLTYLIEFLFRSGPVPSCPDHGDLNADGSAAVSDLTWLVAFLFRNGPDPLPCS